MVEEVSKRVEELSKRIKELCKEQEELRKCLEEKNKQLEILHKQLEREEIKLKALQKPSKQWTHHPSWANIKLTWRECERTPHTMVRWSDAVVSGSLVYFKDRLSNDICVYDSFSKKWCEHLYSAPDRDCSLAVVNSLVTCIWGSKLFSLTREGSHKYWTEIFPSMPTERYYTTALGTGSVLIVAGGIREVVVEVMKSFQWFRAADLPEPALSNASAVVCGDRIYVLGGRDEDGEPTKLVYSCVLSALLQSCTRHGVSKTANIIWEKIADLPVTDSTYVSFHGRLLAIGGEQSSNKSTRDGSCPYIQSSLQHLGNR